MNEAETQGIGPDSFMDGDACRRLFGQVPDLLYLLDVEGKGRFRIRQVNPAVERWLARSNAELVGRLVDEVIPRAREQGVLNRLERCVALRKSTDDTAELELPSGWCSFHATYIPLCEYPGGSVQRIVCIARDVTRGERTHVPRSHRELTSMLHRIAEVAPGAMCSFHLSPDGSVSMPYMSPQLEAVTGFKPEHMGRDATYAHHLINPEDREEHLASIAESARTLSPWRNEFRTWHPQKGEVWIEGRSIPERMPDGSIIWHGFLHDVTDRKRFEEQQRLSERKFRTLAENLPDLVIRYDADCRRLYVNKTFERLTGISAAEAIGHKPGLGWAWELPVSEYLMMLRRVMATGRDEEKLAIRAARDGRKTYYLLRMTPERGPDDRPAGVLMIGRDVTSLKETERELNESRLQLRELAARRDAVREEERKHIARELHDEMGQFLSVLRLQASMLRMQFGAASPALSEQVAGMIELIDRNIQLVRNIASRLRPTVLDLGIAAALEWLVEDFTRYSGIACTLSLGLPEYEMDEPAATALFRVVQESLSNVARHAGSCRVRVSLRRHQGRFRLRVRDFGRGFDVQSATKKSLGLLGMRERVLMVGGVLNVRSAPGQGTLLYVAIPARRHG